MHTLESVQKNKKHKIPGDFQIQIDHFIPARKPDVVIVKKRRKAQNLV